MEIGLDCFSPCLTSMVGQDLQGMSKFADWIKLMTYAHTNAPAGLPFELAGLTYFLVEHAALDETTALNIVSKHCGLPLPDKPRGLETEGLSSLAIERELQRGSDEVSIPILAGIELVDLPGVTCLSPAQIRSDLAAIKRSPVHGLSISWDLLHITHERLELVAQAYFLEGTCPT